MCFNCVDWNCDCPNGQSITMCACDSPHFIECAACGHHPRSGSSVSESDGGAPDSGSDSGSSDSGSSEA